MTKQDSSLFSMIQYCKVHIFWEDHEILRNLHLTFVFMYKSKVEISKNFVAFSEYTNFNYSLLNINFGKYFFYKDIFRLRHQNEFNSIVSLFLGVFSFWSVLIVKTDGKIDEIHYRESKLFRILRIFKSILNWTGAKML